MHHPRPRVGLFVDESQAGGGDVSVDLGSDEAFIEELFVHIIECTACRGRFPIEFTAMRANNAMTFSP
jgi:hypothetical protein